MNRLQDINLIRPILILLLVIHHATSIFFIGGWELPAGMHQVEGYFWLTRATYSFMLECFMLVSGFLFAYQVMEMGKFETIKTLITWKLRRLILPSVLFGAVYYLLFSSLLFFSLLFSSTNHIYYS